MKSIVIYLLGLIFVTCVVSCSDDDNSVKKADLYDISGTYNVNNKDVSRVNILEVRHSNDLKNVSMRLAREGLSVEEGVFFNNKNLYHWADTTLGRVLNLGGDSFAFAQEDQQNTIQGDNAVLSVCSKEFQSPRPRFAFIYCVEARRAFNKDHLSGDLVLHVLKDGDEFKTINTQIEAYTNTRWSEQYLGQWRGELEIFNSEKQRLNISTGDSFDYDILTRFGSYWVQPDDINRVIIYKGERFILHPDEPAILDLERNTNPYINFRFWSEEAGERRIQFNGHFKGANRLEGNITFYRGRGKKLRTLGTYVMVKR